MPPVSSLAAAPGVPAAGAQRRPGWLRDRLWLSSPILWSVLAIEALAVAAQVRYGAVGDVSWMITICEKWLDGQIPYVDFIETNPPAAILIYLPPVALARLIGAPPEATVAAYGFAAVGAAFGVCAAILRRAGLLAQAGPATLVLALVAFTILPGRTFDERDFFVALFALPYLALTACRAGRAPVDWRMALIVGLCIGAMVAIKPPYALVVFAAALFAAVRAGVTTVLRAVEYYVAAGALAAYAAVLVWRFPVYGAQIAPAVEAAYLPVRQSAPQLLANVAVVVWLAFAGLLALVAASRLRGPLVGTAASGALGALVVFFVQGKGWLYQSHPALAFIVIAFGLALDGRRRLLWSLAVAGAAACASAATAILLGAPALDCAVVVALVAGFAFVAAAPRTSGWDGERVPGLAETTAGALIGAACVLYGAPINGPDAAFVRAVAALGPHPRLAAIGEGLGIGFPLVRLVGGVWAQRTQGMLMTAGARRLIDQNPGDSGLAERLAPIIEHDRDMLAEDIARNRPDGVLVSKVGPRFHRWAMSDPKLAAALRNYRLGAKSAVKAWPVDLYVRNDLVGLRPSFALPDGSEGSSD